MVSSFVFFVCFAFVFAFFFFVLCNAFNTVFFFLRKEQVFFHFIIC